MSDFDETLDDSSGREIASQAEPLSLESWLAKNGRASLPSRQNNPQPVDKSAVTDSISPVQSAIPLERSLAVLPGSAAPTHTVKDYIGDRLAKQEQALKDAQGQARQNQAIAGITEGLGQMTAGLAHSNNFNPQSYKYLHDQANQPVEDIQAQQKNKLSQLQEMNAENSFQRTSALDDPNSMQSTIARRLAAQALTKYKQDPSIVDGMSAADLKEFLQKPIDQMEARASREAIQNLKSQEIGLRRQELGQNKEKAAQDKALTTVQTLLESARGNPAAAQAERDIYAAQKADSLAKLYGDPNKLSPQMVKLLVGEVGKIAQGGSPTMHELEGLNVNTMPSRLASAMQTLTNNPSAANAGEFVKQYQDYAHALTKDAQKLIEEKYGRVIETNKKRLGEGNYESLKANYLSRFPKSSEAEARVNVISPDGKTGSVPQSQLQQALQQGYRQAQ